MASEIKHIFFECYVEQGNTIWFSSFMYNGLYKMDKKTLKTTFIGRIPGEKIIQSRLYKAAVLVENKVVLAPCSAKEIAVYDIEKDTFLKIPLRDVEELHSKIRYKEIAKFWTIETYKRNVYIMAHYYPSIIRISMLNYEVTYIDEPIKQLDKSAVVIEAPYLTEGIVEDHTAILPCCCANAFLKFDLVTENYVIEQIPFTGKGFNGICKSGENYWLVPRMAGNILKYNSKRYITSEYDRFPENMVFGNIPFATPIAYKNKLYIPPIHSSSFLVVDMKSGKMDTINELIPIINGNLLDYAKAGDKVKIPIIKDGKLFFFCSRDYQAYIYDIDTGGISHFYIESDGDEIQDYYQTITFYEKKTFIYYEQKDWEIERYIRFIKNLLGGKNSNKNIDVGNKVYETINMNK